MANEIELTAEEQNFKSHLTSEVNLLFTEKAKGLITEQAFKERVDSINKGLEGQDLLIKSMQETIAANKTALETQGLTINELLTKGGKNDSNDIEKQLWEKKDGSLKLWTVCPHDGLRYYRSRY